jgi:hypothetical protein
LEKNWLEDIDSIYIKEMEDIGNAITIGIQRKRQVPNAIDIKTPEGREGFISDIIAFLQRTTECKKGVTIDKIFEEIGDLDFNIDEIAENIKNLYEKGMVYWPTFGKYRVAGDKKHITKFVKSYIQFSFQDQKSMVSSNFD